MSICSLQNVMGVDKKGSLFESRVQCPGLSKSHPVQITGNSERHDVTVSDDWPKLPEAICSEETNKMELRVMKATEMDPLKPVITNYLWRLAFAIELSVCLIRNSTWITTRIILHMLMYNLFWNSAAVQRPMTMSNSHGVPNAKKFRPQSSRRPARRMIPVYALQSVLKNLEMSWRGLLYWQLWEQECCERHSWRKNKVQMSNWHSPVHQNSKLPYQTDISWTFLLQFESNLLWCCESMAALPAREMR